MYNAAKFDILLTVMKVTMIKVNYDKSYEDESQEIFWTMLVQASKDNW